MAEKEYIERGAAIAETRKPRLTDAELRRRLAEIPAADVRPVARGKWIMTEERFAPERICSSCKCRFPVAAGEGVKEILNFCPNCGCAMEET